MKRLQIITKPTAVDDLAEIESDSYGGVWELRVERLQARQLRKLKQRLA